MRLNRALRAAVYAALLVLLATGVAWLLVDASRDPFHPAGERSEATLAPRLLAVHGGAALLFLILLGALIPVHIERNWARDRNRWTGIVMLALNAALIVTAYALYYSGSDRLRSWASDLHIAAGLVLPLWVAVHVWLGRRGRSAARGP